MTRIRPSPLRTSLSRTPSGCTTEETRARLDALRRKALDRDRVAVIRLDDCRDDWIRQAILNEARRQIGRGA